MIIPKYLTFLGGFICVGFILSLNYRIIDTKVVLPQLYRFNHGS